MGIQHSSETHQEEQHRVQKAREVYQLSRTFHHREVVAEVAEMDVHRRAVLGMAAVSNSGSHASSMIDAVIQQVQASTDAPLVERSLEIVHIGDGEHMEKIAGLGAVPEVGMAADWDLDAEEAWLKAGDDDGED